MPTSGLRCDYEWIFYQVWLLNPTLHHANPCFRGRCIVAWSSMFLVQYDKILRWGNYRMVFICSQRASFDFFFADSFSGFPSLILVLSFLFFFLASTKTDICLRWSTGGKNQKTECQSFNQDGLFVCIHICNGHHAGHSTTKLFFGDHQPELLFLAEISSSTSSLTGGVGVHCAGGHSHHLGNCDW